MSDLLITWLVHPNKIEDDRLWITDEAFKDVAYLPMPVPSSYVIDLIRGRPTRMASPNLMSVDGD